MFLIIDSFGNPISIFSNCGKGAFDVVPLSIGGDGRLEGANDVILLLTKIGHFRYTGTAQAFEEIRIVQSLVEGDGQVGGVEIAGAGAVDVDDELGQFAGAEIEQLHDAHRVVVFYPAFEIGY